MKIEVLHVPDCPNLPLLLQQLRGVTAIPITTHMIDSDRDAARFGMAGSPTLLIDGVDPFASPGHDDTSVSCRLYRDDDGRLVPAPSAKQLRDAIAAAQRCQPAALREQETPPGERLIEWRARALALDSTERAVTGRSFVPSRTTGGPPSSGCLGPAGFGGDDLIVGEAGTQFGARWRIRA